MHFLFYKTDSYLTPNSRALTASYDIKVEVKPDITNSQDFDAFFS
jgi:hypothetical protein